MSVIYRFYCNISPANITIYYQKNAFGCTAIHEDAKKYRDSQTPQGWAGTLTRHYLRRTINDINVFFFFFKLKCPVKYFPSKPLNRNSYTLYILIFMSVVCGCKTILWPPQMIPRGCNCVTVPSPPPLKCHHWAL